MTRDDGLRHADCLGEDLLRDPCGFILTRTESRLAFGNGRALLMFEANLPRVFAIGVIRSGSSKRVVLAADAGASAAAMVHEYQGFAAP